MGKKWIGHVRQLVNVPSTSIGCFEEYKIPSPRVSGLGPLVPGSTVLSTPHIAIECAIGTLGGYPRLYL